MCSAYTTYFTEKLLEKYFGEFKNFYLDYTFPYGLTPWQCSLKLATLELVAPE